MKSGDLLQTTDPGCPPQRGEGDSGPVSGLTGSMSRLPLRGQRRNLTDFPYHTLLIGWAEQAGVPKACPRREAGDHEYIGN